MNEIETDIAVIGNETVQSVKARDLAKVLNVDTSNYSKWFKTNSKLFVENQDFICLDLEVERLKGTQGGGQNRVDHLITLDMAKHIALMSKTEKGKEYRQSLINLEKQYADDQFRIFDKEHQKLQMQRVQLVEDEKKAYIKANVVANKATSTSCGFDKMMSKGDMNTDMLKMRELVLEDVVKLYSVMGTDDKRVKELIYEKYQPETKEIK